MIPVIPEYKLILVNLTHYKEQYEIHKHDFKRAMVLKSGLLFWENKRQQLLN